MALSIKSDEADRLARELAAATGESLTDAVVNALRQRLASEQSRRGPGIAERLDKLRRELGELPVLDGRSPDEILGYDHDGLPA